LGISRFSRIHPTAIIAPSASLKVFTPPDPGTVCLLVDEYSHLFGNFTILRPHARIKIGKRCQIGQVDLIASQRIEIGDDVLMAWGITLMDNDSHAVAWEHRKNDQRQCYIDYIENKDNFIKNKDWTHVNAKPIIIGDRCWIGFNSTILKGVVLGDECVVGAGSVVTRSFPAGSVVAGNPAHIIKEHGGLV
jgi:acetyltransferase-like isoleucine patch superfamily enzyme